MAAGVIVFDDRRAREWEPLALTRPIGELLFGSLRLAERVARATGLPLLGHITAPHLRDYREPGAAPVLEPSAVPSDDAVLYWCARAVPGSGTRIELPESQTNFRIDDRIVGWIAAPGHPPTAEQLAELRPPDPEAPAIEVPGRLLDWIWQVMLESPDWAARDLLAEPVPRPATALPDGVRRLGQHPLWIEGGVQIEPNVVLDVREGPIKLGAGTSIRAGTRLAGPAVIGPRSRLLGGSLAQIVTGPFTYVQGEVEGVTFLGYTNKAHQGYLGDSYLGRWVNLGALTTNSNLKNNYHTVRVWTPTGERDTGELKVGCFLGDHVKTGIGLMLNTGTVVGAGANLYGSTMPPKYVRPFSWGEGAALGEYRLDAFLDTAARVLPRRGVEWNEQVQRYLESCWREGRG